MTYDRIECPSCNQKFAQELKFLSHLTNDHGVTDHLKFYLDSVHGGIHPTCQCNESCTEKLRWNGWKQGFTSKFVRGHNAKVAVELKSLQEVINSANEKHNVTDAPPPVKTRKGKVAEKLTIIEGSVELSSSDPYPTRLVPPSEKSNGLNELYEFVKSLSDDVILNDTTALNGMSIDVYSPSVKVGIEFDELYESSVMKNPDNNASSKKHAAAEAAGIKLLHIFEDEWVTHRKIIESMIQHRFGKNTRSIGARECELRVLDPAERKAFMNAGHLEGDCRSSISWGLLYEGVVVAALSLRKPFHRRYSDAYEVGRFCTLPETSVPGALSRLMKAALAWAKEQGCKRMISYVDQRVGEGTGYLAAGFHVISTSSSRLWWTDYKARFNRFAVRANSEIGLTQKQAALNAGVVPLWGCGNVVLQLDITDV